MNKHLFVIFSAFFFSNLCASDLPYVEWPGAGHTSQPVAIPSKASNDEGYGDDFFCCGGGSSVASSLASPAPLRKKDHDAQKVLAVLSLASKKENKK